MAYGIRLATGEVQLLTDSSALTNEQADGLLGGGAELVWVDGEGAATQLDVLQGLQEKGTRPDSSLTSADDKSGAENWDCRPVGLKPLRATNIARVPMASTLRYTTQGPLRGSCSHKHKNIESAVRCLEADDAVCVARGGHTDRRIFVVGNGVERELDEDERAAVTVYKAAKPTQ